MSARSGQVQRLEHKESKDSNIKWFIIGIIPLVNLYFLWKLAESLSGHELVAERYEKLDHKVPKGSTLKWFIGILVAGLAWGFGYVSVLFAVIGGLAGGAGGAFLGAGAGAALFIVGLIIYLYLFWKTSELIAGHDEIYERYARLDHGERKESSAKWFALGFFGLLLSVVFIGVIMVLYFYWKVAWVISGHDVEYVSREEFSRIERGRRAGASEAKKCPNCGASIPQRADFCPECGEELGQKEDKIECPNCGADVPKGANFCSECGAQIGGEET